MNFRLLQLGDSALPVGGYSHSWGLEAAVELGLVRDAPGLERWTRNWLRFALAPNDGVIVAAVCRAAATGNWSAVGAANQVVHVSVSPPTLRHASREMGEQLLALAEGWDWACPVTERLRQLEAEAWHYAPVFATLASATPATSADALSIYLYQAAAGVVGAGVKAIPIGHTHGQQVLAELHETIGALVAERAGAQWETAGSYCPQYEILCDAQSRLYTRLFRS